MYVPSGTRQAPVTASPPLLVTIKFSKPSMTPFKITINDWSGGATFNPNSGGSNQYRIGKLVDNSIRGKLITMPTTAAVNVTGQTELTGRIETLHTVSNTADMSIQDVSGNGDVYNYAPNVSAFLTKDVDTTNNYLHSFYYTALGSSARIFIGDDGAVYNYDAGANTVSALGSPVDLGSDVDFFVGRESSMHGIQAYDRYYVTNGSNVASVTSPANTGGNWGTAAFVLEGGYEAVSIVRYGKDYVGVAATKFDLYYGSTGKVYIWSGVGTTPDWEVSVPTGIQAAWYDGGYLWIWGEDAKIYASPYGGREAQEVFAFQNRRPERDADGLNPNLRIYPSSVHSVNGKIYFGLSMVDSESANYNPAGIYAFNPRNVQNGFNIDRVIPAESDTTSIIRHIKSLQSVLVYSEEFGDSTHPYTGTTNYLKRQKMRDDDTTRYGVASYQTTDMVAPTGSKLRINSIRLQTETLPANTSISILATNELGGTRTFFASGYSTTGDTYGVDNQVLEGRRINLVVTIDQSAGATMPAVLNQLGIEGDVIPDNT